MRIRFTIFPDNGDVEYHCEVNMAEPDLSLEAKCFAERYFAPVASALLGAFEEEWPTDPQEVIEMLDRGGPNRSLANYRWKASKALGGSSQKQ